MDGLKQPVELRTKTSPRLYRVIIVTGKKKKKKKDLNFGRTFKLSCKACVRLFIFFYFFLSLHGKVSTSCSFEQCGCCALQQQASLLVPSLPFSFSFSACAGEGTGNVTKDRPVPPRKERERDRDKKRGLQSPRRVDFFNNSPTILKRHFPVCMPMSEWASAVENFLV